MRIGHMSDLHYAAKTLAEVDRCFGYAVDRAIAERVDAVVISGDSTDHELDAHAPAFVALAKQVRRLADYCPVLMLQGTYSHEPPGTLEIFRLLGGRYPVHVADRIGQVALTRAGHWVVCEEWCFDSMPRDAQCLFNVLPSVNKGAVAAAVGAERASEAVGDAIAQVLAGLGPINRAAREAGMPTVVVSHGTVIGCETEHGVPMAGLDHEWRACSRPRPQR